MRGENDINIVQIFYIVGFKLCILCCNMYSRSYKPLIGNSLLKLQSYSERSQNAGFHPRSHHLAIEQTRPSPSMLGFVDEVLTCFNCDIFDSHIPWRKKFVIFVLVLPISGSCQSMVYRSVIQSTIRSSVSFVFCYVHAGREDSTDLESTRIHNYI